VSRTVLVTGASQGIGAAIVETFARQGDKVVAWSRSGRTPQGATRSDSVDVSHSDQVDRAMATLIATESGPDVVVINAGVTRDGLALRMNDEAWRDVLATNLDGAFFCARSALKTMLKQRSGRVIFVGSVSPFLGVPGQANYAASKAGLVGLARSLASEVGRRGVTVNVVVPGFIATAMTESLDRDEIAARVPLGRVGEPEEVAAAVSFLASDQARYITGAVLAVDGGLSMGL
jgi:NAD(P)-dependent dehydrogenase (short-subunit alcohol dehydrogenase family)